MRKAIDLTLLLLLCLALAEAVLLTQAGDERELVPMLRQGQGQLSNDLSMDPTRIFASRMAVAGDYVTIEDLVRGALAIQRGELDGARPLSARRREQLGEALQKALRDRDTLMELDQRQRTLQQELAAETRKLAAALDPQQLQWMVDQRNAISVGQVEQSYWQQALDVLEGSP